MSTEEAGLSIKIDSSDAPRAAADLEKVTAAGVKTEDVAKRVKKSWLDTIQSVGADTAAMSSKFDALNSTQSKMLAVVERVATQLDRMATAMERTASRSSAVTDAANKNAEALDKVERSARAADAASKSLSETEEQAAARYRAIAQSATDAAAARARDADALRQAATAERELTAAQGATAASAAATRAQLAAQNAQFQVMTNEINETSAALASIGRGAGSMQAIQVQTDKLIKLWSSGRITAEQYDAAVKQIDASEAALVATSARAAAAGDKFIASLKEQAATAGMTARQLLEYRAAQLGVSDRAAPLILQLTGVNRTLNGTGLSARQTSVSLRAASVQFTDMFTSIVAGQNAGTVFLQQGGQLRDQLGGAGAAARALGGYVLGLVTPFTVAAAVVGVLAFSYVKGSSEAETFRKTLILTGNAAGVTSDQLSLYAAQIGAVAGGQSKAAEALNLLAASGRVTGTALVDLGRIAVQMAEATGSSIADMVKEFEAVGKDPVKAVIALNDKYGILTLAVYEQAKALAEQGKQQEASELVARQASQELEIRTKGVQANLGTLQAAWKGLGDVASSAWNKMLDIGREDTLAQKLSAAERDLRARQENIRIASANGSTISPKESDGVAAAQQAVDGLTAQATAASAAAKADSERQRIQREGIISAQAVEVTQTQGASKTEQLTLALKKYQKQIEDTRAADPNSALLDPAKIAAGEAYLRKQYEDKGATSAAAGNVSAHAQQMADLESQIQAEEQLAKSLDLYGAAADKANSGDKLVLKIQNELTLAVVNRANKQTDAQLKEALARAQVLAADQKANDARQKAIKLGQDYDAWQDKLADGTKALSDTLAEQADLYGKTGEARTIATAQSKILRDAEKFLADEQRKGITVTDDMAAKVRDYAKANAELTGSIMAQSQAYQGAQQLMDENKKFAADSILSETDRNKALVEIDADAWRQRIKLAGDGTDAQQKLIEQYDTWYANQMSKPQIEQAKQLISDLDRVFQDGFANMLNGGKGTWESFTQSLVTTFKTTVADQIYKMFVKPIIVQLVGSLTGVSGLGGSSGIGGGSDILSGIAKYFGLSGAGGGDAPSGTGGGNLLGGLNTASTVNTIFGLVKNGISGITDTISTLIAKITGQATADTVAGATANSAAAAIAEGLGQGAGAAALDTAATAAASAAAESATGAAGAAIAEGLGTAASAATSTAATAAAASAAGTAAAAEVASGFGAQLMTKLVSSWPVALAYAVWQNDKMYKDGVRYKDMDVTGVGSLVNAPMKFVDDGLQKIGLNGRIANIFSGLALSAMVWGKNGMFGGETRYGSGPYVGYSTDNQVQGEGGPSGGDPNLENTKAMVQQNYDNSRDLITALGGTADALYMFNDWELSPKKGNSFVRSVVRNDAGDGGPDFDNRIDLDTKDYGDVMAAYVTEMKRSMLAAVANSNVSSVYKDYLANNGDLKTADDATLTSLMDGIQKIQAFSVALKELPFANMRDLTLDAAMSLANFMGGLDKFQASMDSYFNNYYTDAEKFNKQTTDITRQFANIGYDLPTSKAAFRSMAESLDLSTKAGRDTYVALMNLQQGFSDYEVTVGQVADAVTQAAQQQVAAAQQQAEAAQQQQEALKQTLSGNVQAAYDRESQALQARVDNLNSFVDALDKLKDSLNLGDLSPLSPEDKLAEAKRQYEDTLAKAQGGDEGAQGDLATAAQNYLNASKGWNASSEAYAATFAKVQADLAITKASASSALDIAKQQLDEMKKSVDGILKLNDSMQSLAEALASYAAAFGSGNAYLAANPDVNQAFQQDPGGMNANQYAAYHYAAYGAGEGRGSTGVVMNPADEYLMNNPDVLAAYQAGNGGGMTPEQYAAFHYATYGAGEGRSFAVGTNYVPYDMKADIHEGERIIPKADNRALMDMLQRPATSDNGLREELRDLKETLSQLLKAGLNQQAAIAEKDTAERGKLADASRRSSLVTNG